MSIFDEAGKKPIKPVRKKPEESKPLAKDVSFKELESSSFAKITDTEIQEMFDRIKEMQNDLEKKKDDLRDAIALSKQDVIKYFSDPKNFTPEQWDIIQANRSDIEKKTWAVVGKDPLKVRQKQLESKDSKHRKGKTLGARRNWIPIR